MKLHIRFLVVCLMFATQYVAAIEVKGLFEAEVIAVSQSREDRNIALREAFIIVLNRVAASKELMLDPAVRLALANAASYVDQYQYALIADSSGVNSSARNMRVSFNEEAVMELMRGSGLAVWNEMRDEVLVWLAIEQKGKRRLLDAEQDAEINKALQFAAKLKGTPVLLPLMDLEEKQTISVEDIVSAYPEKLLTASGRYGVTAVLSGKIVKQRACWRSEWTLSFNKKVEQWVVPCENLVANLSTAFQGVYDHLSVFYAVKPGLAKAGTVILKITGIKGLNEETRVKQYLHKMPMVTSVGAVTLKQGRRVFQLETTGTRLALREYITLGRELREKGVDIQDNSLLYELIAK